MKVPVSLQDVVGEMDMQSQESVGFLNKHTGELITFSTEDFSAAEDELDIGEYPKWQAEVIEQAKKVLGSDEYLKLPSQYDIHGYRIMEAFCHSIADQNLSDKLLDAITGRGAFLRFKSTIHRMGLENEWVRFRELELGKIAVAWLEEHGIPYRR